MSLSAVVLTVIGLFFALGALDHIFGNRLGLGRVFMETFTKMGAVALGMMGLYSLAPAAAQGAAWLITPVAGALGLDPAAFPPLLFPVDMGGWVLCGAIAQDAMMGSFFGAVAASVFGATVGYCIPVSSGLIRKELHPELALGTLSGLVAIPAAMFAAGLVGGLPALPLLYNLLPMCALSGLLCWGLLRFPQRMTHLFTGFGRVMSAVGLVGIVLQALRALEIWEPLPDMTPFSDACAVVVRIIIAMSGSIVLVEVLTRLLRRPMDALAARLSLETNALAGFLVATVSALIVYTRFEDYSPRGRVAVSAFCASGAFMLGGQFSVVSVWEPTLVGAFFTAKLLSAAVAVPLALALWKMREKNTRIEDTRR